MKKRTPEQWLWLGFFMIFPIMFFGDQFRGTFLFDVFGILALIGAGISLVNFVKILRKK